MNFQKALKMLSLFLSFNGKIVKKRHGTSDQKVWQRAWNKIKMMKYEIKKKMK